MEEIKIQQFKEKLQLSGYAKRVQIFYPCYARIFLRYCEEHEDITSIDDIEPQHITSYHNYMNCTKRDKGSYLSSITIRTRLEMLKTFFQIMYRERLIKNDLSASVLLPKRHNSLPRSIPSEQEMKALLEAAQPVGSVGIRDRAILELLYATGIRSEELRSATVDALYLREKTLLVTGKGSKDRVVPVGDWLVPYLLEYLEAGRPKLVRPNKPTGLLFVSKNGRYIHESNLCVLIRKYAKKSGLQPVKPHAIRHACATHLLRAGADIRYVQELLGHFDLSTTQIYTRVDITFLREAHKRFHPRDHFYDEG